MAEITEINGIKEFQYEGVDEFNTAIDEAKPVRLHTYFASGFLGIGSNWSATFVDPNGNVHAFRTHDVNEGFKERVKPIYNTIKEANIPEVDGIVKISTRVSGTYQVFATERPDLEDLAQKSYDAWLNAAQSLPVEGTLIQYIKDDDTITFDAGNGTTHLTTSFDETEIRTIDDTLNALSQYESRDNKPAIDWFLDMRNK
jgi:hypothetical protein